MKRSSSSLDQQLTRPDEEFHPTSYAKVARLPPHQSRFSYEERSDQRRQEIPLDQSVGDKSPQYSPRHSIILGSFSNPPTYIIHFLDPHLTLLQNFQICSIFGRVRVHGYHLPPCTFYSIFNYRINHPLAIEYIPSPMSITRSLQDVKSLIPDDQLAGLALFNVQQKGGDILLIRKDLNNDSLYLRTIREHHLYSQWFLEKYHWLEGDQWRQLEKDLHIRLIETTDQTAILPQEQFITTVDHIITRWLNETTKDLPFVVLICGEKDMGKSTFIRYLINRAVNHINSTYDLTYFDCDIGQCEFTMGGCLSYVCLDSPLLGPPCSHMKSNLKSDRLFYYGQVTPQKAPIRYLQYIDQLRRLWNIDRRNVNSKRSLIFINTMGWGTGLGLELLKETICMCCPNVIVQLGDSSNSAQGQDKMPDLTLQWLLQQPVYTPYRRKIQMNNRRQEDYDGQLNYEYIKLQSVASGATHRDTPKLRARDHRLLATWSYFFSSNLSRLRLSWSQFIHVSLLDNRNQNPNNLPDCLEHSIVALCTSENIDQWRNASNCINGIFHRSDCQDEVFQCSGFGWIEHCDKETQTYEIYTPSISLSNINVLVSGAFDTPDEFEYMFKNIR